MIQGADLFSSPPSFNPENTKAPLSLSFSVCFLKFPFFLPVLTSLICFAFVCLCVCVQIFLHYHYFFSAFIWNLHYDLQPGNNVRVLYFYHTTGNSRWCPLSLFCGPLLFTECFTWTQWQIHTRWPSRSCTHTQYASWAHTATLTLKFTYTYAGKCTSVVHQLHTHTHTSREVFRAHTYAV